MVHPPLLINRAYAADSGNEALTAQLNTTFLDASSEVLSNALRASSSTFVAEAQITPSGEALYLLTSNHIQRALFGLDPEPCSIYRVQVSDGEALCLLPSDRGDIEPRALVSSMEFDYSRRGIDFRADGAAVMQGFNWSQQLPSGVSGEPTARLHGICRQRVSSHRFSQMGISLLWVCCG